MIRKLLLILRFYYSAMFFFCAAVSVALAWLVKVHGPEIIPMCMLGKAAVYPLYLYVWIVQRYGDEFFYYRNLGVRRRELLGENFIYHDMVRTGRAVERLGIQKFQLLLPIPGKELQLNPLLEPNPGY